MSGVVTAGVDVGTGAVKAAIVAAECAGPTVLATHREGILRRDPAAVADLSFERCLRAAGIPRGDVSYVASTGEGDAVRFRDGHFYGMTTHARGGAFLFPGAQGVIDLGALHARVLAIDARSRVVRHRMTSQCASGTGQFLENIARYLGVRLKEIGPLSLSARRAESCSGVCAVLSETDVINMVSRGVPTAEILRGIHESIAQRIVKLLRAATVEAPIVLTGGMADDAGLRAAMERRLAEEGTQVTLCAHPLSAYAGAIGAALWAAHRHAQLAASKVPIVAG